MNYFTSYIYFIIGIKIIFILLAISHIYFKIKGEAGSDVDEVIVYWKERLEFVFVVLMAILLIYIFNPRKSHINLLNKEIQILLYLFGFILLITANWQTFFHESKWFKYLQETVGKKE
jgi:ABC-type dipeptide/oligopeptide/nickel transport system permease subunit